MCFLIEQSMKRRGKYGNVDSNTGYVPDTPTQMLRHLQRFLEKAEKHVRVNVHINGTLSLRQWDN